METYPWNQSLSTSDYVLEVCTNVNNFLNILNYDWLISFAKGHQMFRWQNHFL